MGMPAEQAMAGITPQINDLVIRGYFLSIDVGSAEKRVAIGFGSGESELRVAVEGFQMTAQGLRKLGSGTTDSTGSKAPGGALGLATLLATHNPAGLIIGTGMKVYGEESGRARSRAGPRRPPRKSPMCSKSDSRNRAGSAEWLSFLDKYRLRN